ncbi:MAG: NTP transferase domain-containing protein [Spirochaetota bacterium]
MEEIGILIPAAGASSRMGGRDKLLESVGGFALLSLVAARAREATRCVCVALPGTHGPRHAAIEGLDVEWVQVPGPSEGMAASLRAALPAMPTRLAGVMILPADMPEIDTPDGVWACDRALRCSAVCPLGVYPAKHIAVLQRKIEKARGSRRALGNGRVRRTV